MAQIDEDVIAQMHEEEKQIDLGISDEKQINRTELNFLCEMLSTLKALAKSIDDMNNAFSMAFAENLTGYMQEFTTNFNAEEKRLKIMKNARNRKKST